MSFCVGNMDLRVVWRWWLKFLCMVRLIIKRGYVGEKRIEDRILGRIWDQMKKGKLVKREKLIGRKVKILKFRKKKSENFKESGFKS